MAAMAAVHTWATWNYAYTTSTPTVWTYWNGVNTGSSSTTLNSTVTWETWNTSWEVSREQAEAYKRQRAEERLREEAERQRLYQLAQEAQKRAEELLLSMLSTEQAASYRDSGWFEIIGSRGGRWRIRNRGQSGNVDLMPEIGEERLMSYCAHPPGNLPPADAHLAQMLRLVTDEDGFRKIANVQYRRPEPLAA